jgi:hypothetical protein
VSRSATPPEVEIHVSGCTEGELEKALRVAATGLAKKRETEAQETLSDQNPATRHLVRFIDEAYRTMVDSLADQINKILEEV